MSYFFVLPPDCEPTAKRQDSIAYQSNYHLNRLAITLFLLFSMAIYSWTGGFARSLKCRQDTTKICVLFPVNSSGINIDFADNDMAVSALDTISSLLESDTTYSISSISVYGTASPDGPITFNRKLAMARCSSLLRLMRSSLNRDFNMIRTDSFVYSWSDAPSRSILPQLRSAYAEIEICHALHDAHKEDTIPVRKVCVDTLERTPIIQSAPQPEGPIFTIPSSEVTVFTRDYDRFAIKTNAAYLAAGVTNIGGEMAVSDRWSIDLPIVYSPYTLARTYRMRFLYIQPEARFWLDRPLLGHFFGVHAHVGIANVSFDRGRYQTPDGFFGGGISYGYSLPVAKRWSIEFTIGFGYFHTKYDSYYNVSIPEGQRFEKGTPLNYWGIDKLGINIVYRFGDKSGKMRKEEVEP